MMKLVKIGVPVVSILIGLFLAAVGGVRFYYSVRDTGFHIAGPGSTVVTIVKPGDYTLWNEASAMVDGQFKTFPDHLPPGATITVTNKADGSAVPVNASFNASIEKGSVRRVSVGAVTFESPGKYEVSVTGFTEKRSLYLDESKLARAFFSMVTTVMGGLILMLGLVLGIVFWAVSLRKKKT